MSLLPPPYNPPKHKTWQLSFWLLVTGLACTGIGEIINAGELTFLGDVGCAASAILGGTFCARNIRCRYLSGFAGLKGTEECGATVAS